MKTPIWALGFGAALLALGGCSTCPVSGDHLGGMGTPINYVYKREGKPDQLIRLCCRHCLSVFLGNREKYLAKLEAAKRPAEPAPADAKQPEGHAH